MSSAQTASSAVSGAEIKATKSTLSPIPVFDTPLAKGISFGRIATLLGLLALRMDALITDPVLTLKTSLPVVAAIQVAYAVLCIPVAGTQVSKASKKARPGDRKKADTSGPNPVSVCFS
jgi:phosphatidylinositol glycan class F